MSDDDEVCDHMSKLYLNLMSNSHFYLSLQFYFIQKNVCGCICKKGEVGNRRHIKENHSWWMYT